LTAAPSSHPQSVESGNLPISSQRAQRGAHDGTEPPWLSKTPTNVFPVGAATISSFFNAPITLSLSLDRVDLLLLLSFCGTFILISPFLALPKKGAPKRQKSAKGSKAKAAPKKGTHVGNKAAAARAKEGSKPRAQNAPKMLRAIFRQQPDAPAPSGSSIPPASCPVPPPAVERQPFRYLGHTTPASVRP
jgi:hypothetical protein